MVPGFDYCQHHSNWSLFGNYTSLSASQSLCAVSNCYIAAASGAHFCSHHQGRCIEPGCGYAAGFSSSRCSLHQRYGLSGCRVDRCYGRAANGTPYCDEHRCGTRDCLNPRGMTTTLPSRYCSHRRLTSLSDPSKPLFTDSAQTLVAQPTASNQRCPLATSAEATPAKLGPAASRPTEFRVVRTVTATRVDTRNAGAWRRSQEVTAERITPAAPSAAPTREAGIPSRVRRYATSTHSSRENGRLGMPPRTCIMRRGVCFVAIHQLRDAGTPILPDRVGQAVRMIHTTIQS